MVIWCYKSEWRLETHVAALAQGAIVRFCCYEQSVMNDTQDYGNSITLDSSGRVLVAGVEVLIEPIGYRIYGHLVLRIQWRAR